MTNVTNLNLDLQPREYAWPWVWDRINRPTFWLAVSTISLVVILIVVGPALWRMVRRGRH
jgi:hypothetical protein